MGKASLQAAGHSQSPARVPQQGHDLLSVDSTGKDLSILLGPDFVVALNMLPINGPFLAFLQLLGHIPFPKQPTNGELRGKRWHHE